jgi:hypothetical protein
MVMDISLRSIMCITMTSIKTINTGGLVGGLQVAGPAGIGLTTTKTAPFLKKVNVNVLGSKGGKTSAQH